MSLPLVAIVGRPNVGKSTLFNKLCGKRISIVKDEVGVTRDRLYTQVEWCGYEFTLVDTGGISIKNDQMYKNMLLQANIAIDTADVIIMVVDGKVGLQEDDYRVANIVRKSNKKTILAINKLDNNEQHLVYDFYSLGIDEYCGISCEQQKGLGDLLDLVVKNFEKQDNIDEDCIKIALVGKPNVGKSSIVNKILGYNRVIVSDIAGTTRDAVDTDFDIKGKKYKIIDTAGMRRKRGIEYDSVEAYGVMRSLSAIKRADIVLIVFDASDVLSEQDIRIAGLVHEEKKPSIIVYNKWDLVEKDTFTSNKYKKDLDVSLAFMSYFLPVFVSALQGTRVLKILDIVDNVLANASRKIQTSILNTIIGEAVAANQPSAPQGQRLKIFYSTQSGVNPPRFTVFVNKFELVHNTYKRYLENSIRKAVDFSGTPIKMQFNNRKNEDELYS